MTTDDKPIEDFTDFLEDEIEFFNFDLEPCNCTNAFEQYENPDHQIYRLGVDEEVQPQDRAGPSHPGGSCNVSSNSDTEEWIDFSNNEQVPKLGSSSEAAEGVLESCTCPPHSPFQDSEKLNKYLSNMVFLDYFKKLPKEYKIVIFDEVTKYWQNVYPHLVNKEFFQKLSRNDKRNVPPLDKRLMSIGGFIYKAFESDDKMKVIIPIYKQVCKIIKKNNTKKNKAFYEELKDFISKYEQQQNN